MADGCGCEPGELMGREGEGETVLGVSSENDRLSVIFPSRSGCSTSPAS